jgi:hypothetical protein
MTEPPEVRALPAASFAIKVKVDVVPELIVELEALTTD